MKRKKKAVNKTSLYEAILLDHLAVLDDNGSFDCKDCGMSLCVCRYGTCEHHSAIMHLIHVACCDGCNKGCDRKLYAGSAKIRDLYWKVGREGFKKICEQKRKEGRNAAALAAA